MGRMRRPVTLFYSCVLLAILAMTSYGIETTGAPQRSSWRCTTKDQEPLGDGIRWWRGTCVGDTPAGNVGPIVVNMVHANLSDPNVLIAVKHAIADVNTLPDIMAGDERLVAGINGGYFYRVDKANFFDDVCFGKQRAEALRPANAAHPNFGIGDGLIVEHGKLIASNCNATYGYNMPVVLVLNGSRSSIRIQSRAEGAPAGADNALAAGPNLVSCGPSGPFTDVPAGDQNVNKYEHAANTAVGLTGGTTCEAISELVLVTFDGNDHCLFNTTCGINSYQLAFFMRDHVGALLAMNMDQGGSTTMVVTRPGGAPREVVSCSSTPDCGGDGRLLYSGLFVGRRSN